MKTIKIFSSLVTAIALFFPYLSYAAWSWGQPLVQSCDGVTVKCGFSAFIGLFNTALQFLLLVSPFVAAVALVIAGIIYVTAGGDEGRISTAHSIFTNTLWGFLILLSAWLVVKAILIGFGVKPAFNLL